MRRSSDEAALFPHPAEYTGFLGEDLGLGWQELEVGFDKLF